VDKKIGTIIKVLPIKREVSLPTMGGPGSKASTYYDSILIWYRDAEGKKQYIFVPRAEVPYYILKDLSSPERYSPPMFIERDKVERKTAFSDMLYNDIAGQVDSLTNSYLMRTYLDSCIGNPSAARNILKHNLIYDADMDIADRYIQKFHEEYEPDKGYALHKCFMDIEVDLAEKGLKPDSKGNVGYPGFPDEEIAPCPVNIITLIDAKNNDVHTFICRNKLNDSQKEFEANQAKYVEELRQETLDELQLSLGRINLYFFDTEAEMIIGYFKKLHELDPDILSAWNMSFDEITLLNRLKKVLKNADLPAGNVPAEYVNINGKNLVEYRVCDEKYMYVSDEAGNSYWLTPKAYYRADKGKSFVDRIDTYTILDGINHFDQMLYYANIRKSSGMKESYSLDSVANEELGVEKLDYTGYTIKTLPWKNYPKFFKYNVRDVILLVLLEKKNLDYDMVQRLSEITNTRKEKVFKKTVSLKNFVSKFALEEGFVMNDNKNTSYGRDDGGFEANYLLDIKSNQVQEHDPDYYKSFEKRENYGAYVGDPLLNKPCGIPDSSGNPSKYVFENVFDEDFSSLYPSIIMAYSLSPNGQVGKFFLLDDEVKSRLISDYGYDGMFMLSKNEEGSTEENKTDLGPTLVDSLISHNWSRIGEKFFNLPSTEDIIKDMKQKKKVS